MTLVSMLVSKVGRGLCLHKWTQWEREERTLRGPFGITGPHVSQTRRCMECGWHQEADVEKVKPKEAK